MILFLFSNCKSNERASLVVCWTLAAFIFLPRAEAVIPPPDGGYPGGNTAEGQNALFSLTSGTANTAVGWLSLKALTTGQFNTAIGAGTLALNTADQNTATGAGALLSNTIGAWNTANGAVALFSNTQGNGNNAIGYQALYSNTTANLNTAVGYQALSNTTSDNNTAIGAFAGTSPQPIGRNNIYIGDYGFGGDNNVISIGAYPAREATYIGGIYGEATGGVPVVINNGHKLGVAASSRRYKEEITPMKKASEALFALKPVTFRYKPQIDPSHKLSFGLVAEDVAKVSADLVSRDKEGKPFTVRYDAVNAMLLNEFLKAHRKVEQQQATIRQLESTVAQQRKDFQATVTQITARLNEQAAQIQKVSAQLEASKPAPQMVSNNQ